MPYLSALESDWSVHGLTVIVCVSTVVASLHVSRTEVYSLRSHPFHVCCVVQQCSPSARICIIIGWSTEGDAEHLSYAYRHTAAHKQVREREGERAKKKKSGKSQINLRLKFDAWAPCFGWFQWTKKKALCFASRHVFANLFVLHCCDAFPILFRTLCHTLAARSPRLRSCSSRVYLAIHRTYIRHFKPITWSIYPFSKMKWYNQLHVIIHFSVYVFRYSGECELAARWERDRKINSK